MENGVDSAKSANEGKEAKLAVSKKICRYVFYFVRNVSDFLVAESDRWSLTSTGVVEVLRASGCELASSE